MNSPLQPRNIILCCNSMHNFFHFFGSGKACFLWFRSACVHGYESNWKPIYIKFLWHMILLKSFVLIKQVVWFQPTKFPVEVNYITKNWLTPHVFLTYLVFTNFKNHGRRSVSAVELLENLPLPVYVRIVNASHPC